MEVSRRQPPQEQQRSIRLWDLGWGLWGAFRFVLGSLLAVALRRGRLAQEEAALSNGSPQPPALTSSAGKLKSAPSRRLSKASEVCGGGGGGRSWIITWVVVLASPRLWVRAGAGFAWLLVARWTSLISLTLRWTSSLVAALKEADAKSSR